MCYESTKDQDNALAALDSAIGFCEKRISVGPILTDSFIPEILRSYIFQTIESKRTVITPRGFRIVMGFHKDKDINILLEGSILERISVVGIGWNKVPYTIDQLSDILKNQTVDDIFENLGYLVATSDRLESVDLHAFAEIWRKASTIFRSNGDKLKAKAIRYNLSLRKFLISSTKDDISTTRREFVKGVKYLYKLCI